MNTNAYSSPHSSVSNLEIIKPHFFPGQYLNDDDLQSIVKWAEKRLELQPMSNTWGIVCGLRMSPAVNARKNEPQLNISSGYGLDACQRLCVVDSSINIPLPTGPCASCESSDENIQLGPYGNIPRNELAVFDYFLEPCDIDARKSVGASKDGTRNCSVVRFKVGAKVSWKRVYFPLEETTSSTPAKEDSPELKLLDELQKLPWWKDDEPATIKNHQEQIKNWLTSKTKQFPELLRNWPMMLQEKVGGSTFQLEALVELLSWMCFSLRMPSECCPVADECAAIPIARVWLRTQKNKQQVAWIDDRYPYRKFTTSTPNAFDLRRWIGREFQETDHAATLGQVKLEKTEWKIPSTVKELRTIFYDEPNSSQPGSSIAVLCKKLWNDASDSHQSTSETVLAFGAPSVQPTVQVASTPVPSGPPTLGQVNEPNTNDQGASDQGTGDQGTGDQGTGGEGTGGEGTDNQGTGDLGAGDLGADDQGTGDQGTGDQGTADQGTADQSQDSQPSGAGETEAPPSNAAEGSDSSDLTQQEQATQQSSEYIANEAPPNNRAGGQKAVPSPRKKRNGRKK